MKRFLALLLMDYRFQFKQGIHPAYIGLTALMAVMLALMPPEIRRTVLPLVIFGEPSILGMFFVGGLLYFEQDQRVIHPLFASPVRVSEYLAAKAVSLASISIAMTLVFLVLFTPPTFRWLLALAGTLLTAVFFTFTGIILSMAVKSVMTYLMLSGFADLPAGIPLLRHFGLADSPLFRLIPTDGTLRLAAAATAPAGSPLDPLEMILSLGVLLAGTVILFFPARARIRAFTVTGKGGMR
jgi:fluoroquinolone transport system permease protein